MEGSSNSSEEAESKRIYIIENPGLSTCAMPLPQSETSISSGQSEPIDHNGGLYRETNNVFAGGDFNNEDLDLSMTTFKPATETGLVLEMESMKEQSTTEVEVLHSAQESKAAHELHVDMASLHLAHVIRMKMHARVVRQDLAFKRAGRRVLWPGSKEKLCWDTFNFCLLVYSIFQIPYSLAFSNTPCVVTWLENFNLFVDCFFLCDCIINFFTAYMDEEAGVMIVDYKQIALNYAKGWLVFDLVSSLPLDRILCNAVRSNNSQGFVGFIKAVRLIKVVRFLRMLRLAKMLQEVIGNFASNSIRLLKFLGFLVFCAHLCACIWHGVIDSFDCQIPQYASPSGTVICNCSGPECKPWNWLIKYDEALYFQGEILPEYIVSIYYAIVTLTTLGYGDVTPTNDMERGISSALALSGGVLVSFLISSISSLVSKRNAVEVAIQDQITKFSDLCNLKMLPREVQERSRRHMLSMMNTLPLLVQQIRFLPRASKSEVVDFLALDNVGSLPLLQGMDRDCRVRLAEVLRPCTFYAGASIFEAMDIPTEIYWIFKGEIDILDVSGKGIGKCGPGDMIGIVEMFPENSVLRLRSARARTRCELLELTKDDFINIVMPYMPDLYKVIGSYASALMEQVDFEQFNAYLKVRSQLRCKVLYDLHCKHCNMHNAISKTFVRAQVRSSSPAVSKPYMVSPRVMPILPGECDSQKTNLSTLSARGTAISKTTDSVEEFIRMSIDSAREDSGLSSREGSRCSSPSASHRDQDTRMGATGSTCVGNEIEARNSSPRRQSLSTGRTGQGIQQVIHELHRTRKDMEIIGENETQISEEHARTIENVSELKEQLDSIVAFLVNVRRNQGRTEKRRLKKQTSGGHSFHET